MQPPEQQNPHFLSFCPVTMNSNESRDLRAALQYAVAQICTEQELNAGIEMSSGAIQALAELAFQYATTSLSNDLQAFASHANRKLIKADDVMLVARNNESLKEKLLLFSESTLTPTKRPVSTLLSNPAVEARNVTSFREKLIRNMDSTQESDNSEDIKNLKGATSEGALKRQDWDNSSNSEAEFEKENEPKPKRNGLDRSIVMLESSSDGDQPKPPMKRLKIKSVPRAKRNSPLNLSDTDESI